MHIFVGRIWWNFHVILKLQVNDSEIMNMSRGRPTYVFVAAREARPMKVIFTTIVLLVN